MRLVLLILLVAVGLVRAQDRQDYVFNIDEENDKFVTPSTDKHYTQGLHLTLMWPDEQVPWLSRPLSWMPTLIPVRLTFEIVETPLASVGVPLPKEVDPNLKLIVFPETATPFVVRVALRFTVPPKVPLAGATTRAVLVAFTFSLTGWLPLDPRPSAASPAKAARQS